MLLRDRGNGALSNWKCLRATCGACFELVPCVLAVGTIVMNVILGKPFAIAITHRWRWNLSLVPGTAVLLLGSIAIGMLLGKWIYHSLQAQAFPSQAEDFCLQGHTEKEQEQNAMLLMSQGQVPAIRRLGRQFKSFVEINFERLKEAASLFEKDLAPDRLILSLSLLVKTPIIPGETLLFF